MIKKTVDSFKTVGSFFYHLLNIPKKDMTAWLVKSDKYGFVIKKQPANQIIIRLIINQRI